MAISTISRTAMTDDDGTGTTGTVFNNVWLTALYNAIDTLFSAAATFGSTLRTGYTNDTTTYTQTNANLLSGNNAESVGVVGDTSNSNINMYLKGTAARKVTVQANNDGVDGGKLSFYTKTSGAGDVSVKAVLYNDGGFVVGSPTGGDKGAGTVNAVAVYDDNVLLTDWVFELAFRGNTDAEHADRLYPIAEVERVARAECRLPWMPTPTEFEAQRHAGGMIRRLWQGQEQQQLYIFELERRVEALEARLAEGDGK